MTSKKDIFDDMSPEELMQAEEKIKRLMQRRMEAKKRDALNQIKEIVADHELSFDEVTTAIRTISKRGKAVAIFRNPDNPRQTWSGKGDAPDWYASHPDPESLRIPGV